MKLEFNISYNLVQKNVFNLNGIASPLQSEHNSNVNQYSWIYFEVCLLYVSILPTSKYYNSTDNNLSFCKLRIFDLS